MFLSKLCAVVTSFDTTNAFTGFCSAPATTSANCLLPLSPTLLKLGGGGGGGGGVDALGAIPAPPPLPPNCGVFVATIFLTLAIPATTAAPAAAAPKTGPTIGIPANDL